MKKISLLFGVLSILASIYVLFASNLLSPAPLEAWLIIGCLGLLGIFYIIAAIRGKFNGLSKASYTLTSLAFCIGIILMLTGILLKGSYGEIQAPLNNIGQIIILICLFVSLISIIASLFINNRENGL